MYIFILRNIFKRIFHLVGVYVVVFACDTDGYHASLMIMHGHVFKV